MSRLFPKGTNADYQGHPIAPWFVTLAALGTLVPGGIHVFLPDGGAGVIAGLDLSRDGETVIRLFAWAGATQMVWGAMLLVVSLYYRSLVPLALLFMLVERSILATSQWILKPPMGEHLPPGVYATLVVIPVILVMLYLALSKRTQNS